jgi:hypothetical protein
MNARRFHLVHESARRSCADLAMRAPDGTVALFRDPFKTRGQEERYHAMVGDIARQCEFMGRSWDEESWKRLLIDAFVNVKRDEARAAGEPDPFRGQGQVVPSLDGERVVQLGVQSRGFSKAQGSDFIEFLFAWGAERSVCWSDPKAGKP